MPTNIAFAVPGDPQGKARARSTRSGHHYTPTKTVDYERSIATIARQIMLKPWNGPVAVEIEAIHPIPASWSKKRQQQAIGAPATCKPDADNIGKIVADGGNGTIWADDRQITDMRIQKRYGLTPEVRVRAALISE
jgi:Holliday junction resolvase RusA-like endonuclease